LTQADRDDGIRSGPTTDGQAENRELRKQLNAALRDGAWGGVVRVAVR
jgi:hypothetical protein